MGKNLKRQNDVLLGTPGGASRQGGKPPLSIGGKRHKQMSLVPFLRTPAHVVEDTPALLPKVAKADISSTGLQKLGQLNLRTQQKQQQKASTVAPTQERPAVEPTSWHETSPTGEDDFVISMSQTYERTQPEPCTDYGRQTDCDDVELSLRRSQHYLASGPTQHYSQHQQHNYHHHHHDLLLVSAVAALDDRAAVCATSTATDAWEASVAEASALAADAPTASVLLPPAHALEGQGSNKPECLPPLPGVVSAAVALGAHEFTLALKHVALRRGVHAPERTPDLQGAGGSCGSAGSESAYTAATTEDVADDGTTPPVQVGVPLFPIFTQGRGRRKPPIHLIRHGESEYNLACRRRSGFQDPSDIFDARLTAHGMKQARELRPQLFDLMQKLGDPLFIVSPLSRAIETFLHMLPDPGRLRILPSTPPAPGQARAAGAAAGPSQLLPDAGDGKEQRPPEEAEGCSHGVVHASGASGSAEKPINMMICPFLCEFLQTTGDVGRPRSVLIKEFPQIAEQLRKGLDKERWWYENSSRGPNCAISRTLSSTEPDKVAKARVERFRSFVFSQPHRPIVVVGHANFFKTLMNDSHYMGNCQMTAWAPP